MGTQTVRLRAPAPASRIGSGAAPIVIAFTTIILGGAGLLSLPLASESGDATNFYDSVFTAVSAVCTTGLVVVETQTHWSFFGELVILVLFQVGGLGYMVGTATLLWMLGRRLGVRDHEMLRLYYGAPTMGETLFHARAIGLYALAFEVTGAVVLYIAFVLADVPPSTSVWWAIFHAVSAFNLAGFNVTGADMAPFTDDPLVLGTIAVLAVAGSIGAVPVVIAIQRRSIRRAPLDARFIFYGAAIILAGMTALLAIWEWDNQGTLGALDTPFRPVVAAFQAATWTSGFSAVPIGELSDHTKLALLGVMLVGGAPGSAAGGIKIGVVAVIVASFVATLRGRDTITALGREIPQLLVNRAILIAFAFSITAFIVAIASLATSSFNTIDAAFEAVSAVGTVGWAPGLTGEFNTAGQSVLIAGMLLGRFGILILVLQMTRRRRRRTDYRRPIDSIRLG